MCTLICLMLFVAYYCFQGVFLRQGRTVHCIHGPSLPQTLDKTLAKNLAKNLIKNLVKNLAKNSFDKLTENCSKNRSKASKKPPRSSSNKERTANKALSCWHLQTYLFCVMVSYVFARCCYVFVMFSYVFALFCYVFVMCSYVVDRFCFVPVRFCYVLLGFALLLSNFLSAEIISTALCVGSSSATIKIIRIDGQVMSPKDLKHAFGSTPDIVLG